MVAQPVIVVISIWAAGGVYRAVSGFRSVSGEVRANVAVGEGVALSVVDEAVAWLDVDAGVEVDCIEAGSVAGALEPQAKSRAIRVRARAQTSGKSLMGIFTPLTLGGHARTVLAPVRLPGRGGVVVRILAHSLIGQDTT